uniref:Uncharacterized protein n=1 Tax=Oryza glumipatula TaxID=40148 RepID=A0A0E0BC47_9ORYZ
MEVLPIIRHLLPLLMVLLLISCLTGNSCYMDDLPIVPHMEGLLMIHHMEDLPLIHHMEDQYPQYGRPANDPPYRRPANDTSYGRLNNDGPRDPYTVYPVEYFSKREYRSGSSKGTLQLGLSRAGNSNVQQLGITRAGNSNAYDYTEAAEQIHGREDYRRLSGLTGYPGGSVELRIPNSYLESVTVCHWCWWCQSS